MTTVKKRLMKKIKRGSNQEESDATKLHWDRPVPGELVSPPLLNEIVGSHGGTSFETPPHVAAGCRNCYLCAAGVALQPNDQALPRLKRYRK